MNWRYGVQQKDHPSILFFEKMNNFPKEGVQKGIIFIKFISPYEAKFGT